MTINQLSRRQFSVPASRLVAGLAAVRGAFRRRVRRASQPNWQKLQAVKDKYDPHGVFHTFLGH